MIADANEVLPRLWIGTCNSCDHARGQGFFCMNMLEGPHTDQPLCVHNRILGDDGKVIPEKLFQASRYIDWCWANGSYRGVLVHCGAGVERSPLTVAVWMTQRFALTLDAAYAWLKQHRPQVEDRRMWLP
jgi:hypothetical protein